MPAAARQSGSLMSVLHPRKCLSNLNSQRAFLLFAGALLIGCFLVFGGWGKPFFPAVPVLVYGLALIISQEAYFVHLGAQVRDSPYFLGFILTLLEILNVLLIGLPQGNMGAFLYREIGAAILTTAAGLMMRQRLLANDTAEEAQERIFRTIAEQVRRDTVEFHQTQRLFVNLIREFVAAREQMFSHEEKASSDYLKALNQAITELSSLPKRVETIATALETSGSRIAQISSALESAMRKTIASHETDLQKLTNSLLATRARLNDEYTSLAAAVGNTTDQLNGYVARLGQASSAATRSAADFQQSIQQFSSSYNNAKQGIDEMVQDLRRVSTDITAIDEITDDLVRILRERITALDGISTQP